MFLSALLAATMLSAAPAKIFEPGNLVAWCVVPFDAKKRGPAERAEMLQKLGFKKFAYDWRAEHLPTFEQEVIELKKRDIELTAVWFPAVLNADAKALLAVIEKHKLTPMLWVMIPEPAGKIESEKVASAAKALAPVVEAAGKLGCRVSLYNHGGWAGEPETMVAVVKAVDKPHAGIVYNLHHGHDHLCRFPAELQRMLPHLHAINLNGMHADGDRTGRKIEVLGEGPEDLPILRAIEASGYPGVIGVLGHTDDDAEARLADNLAGLARMRALLAGEPGLPHLQIRSHRPDTPPAFAVSADRRSISYGPLAGHEPIRVTLDGDPRPLEAERRLEKVREEDFARFTPRFMLTVGTAYRATIVARGATVSQRLVVPPDRPPAVPTRVVSVSGLPDSVPENTLRFYLHFSRPMASGEGLKHVHLANNDGDPVPDAFLDLAEELWNPGHTRLTLIFDPARVKRELAPREALGPILEIGRGYRLTVDAAWPDYDGFPLGATFTKDFTATRADEAAVDPAKWKVDQSVPGLIRVAFEKPLDAALADRMIRLVTPDGRAVPAQKGMSWGDAASWTTYRPKSNPLPPGEYLIRVDSRLEDHCGNRVGRAFEVNLAAPADDIPAFVDVPVTVK